MKKLHLITTKKKNGKGTTNGNSNGKSKKPRKEYNTRLSPAEWEEIKWKYIRDPARPFEEYAREYDVAVQGIRMKSAAEQWTDQKIAFWQEARIKVRSNILNLFVDAGLPPERLIRLIADGAVETRKLFNSNNIVWQVTTTKAGKVKRIAKSLSKTIEVIDNTTTFEYRKFAAQLMDMMPAPKATQSEKQEEFLPIVTHMERIVKKEEPA